MLMLALKVMDALGLSSVMASKNRKMLKRTPHLTTTCTRSDCVLIWALFSVLWFWAFGLKLMVSQPVDERWKKQPWLPPWEEPHAYSALVSYGFDLVTNFEVDWAVRNEHFRQLFFEFVVEDTHKERHKLNPHSIRFQPEIGVHTLIHSKAPSLNCFDRPRARVTKGGSMAKLMPWNI
jgi:hypothetical protein